MVYCSSATTGDLLEKIGKEMAKAKGVKLPPELGVAK